MRPTPLTFLLHLLLSATVLSFLLAPRPSASTEGILFLADPFVDTGWQSRGWYDSPHMVTTPDKHIEGSSASFLWQWPEKGAIGTTGGGGRVRFTPVADGKTRRDGVIQ